MNALLTLGIVVYSIICVLLILIIIIQGGKAEGLFSSAQANVLGSQRGNALSKATTFLSTIFIVGALLISVAISTQKTAFENVSIDVIRNNRDMILLDDPLIVIKLRLPDRKHKLSRKDGFRLIYLVYKNSERVIFMSIYPKNGPLQKLDITDSELLDLLEEYNQEAINNQLSLYQL